MRLLPVWIVVSLLIVGGGSTWLLKGQAPVNPTIPAPTLTPNLVTANTPTEVTATVSIPEPTLNPTTVELLRVNANGTTAVVAEMNDTGKNGDQKPGDKVFTTKVTLDESQAGEVNLQVSAAFRGILRRSFSTVTVIQVWKNFSSQAMGLSINYPATLSVSQPQPDAVQFISPTSATLVEAPHILITKKSNPLSKTIFEFYKDPSQADLLAQSNGIYATGILNGTLYYVFNPALSEAGMQVVVIPVPGYFIEIQNSGASSELPTGLFGTMLSSLKF